MKQTLLQKYKAVMPEGAGAIFSIQIFATLSYSVFFSTLILYATNGMHLNDALAASVTGAFLALNYFLHLLGGSIGGRLMSYRSLFCIGICMLALGCVIFSFPTLPCFYWGLTIFLSGSGLMSTSINCMVTQLFEPEDKRRETAFLWIYSGMNVGFFTGFMISGYFHLQHLYQPLFLLSAVSNVVALGLMFYYWKLLKDRNTTFIDLPNKQKILLRSIGISLIVAMILIIRSLFEAPSLSNHFISAIGVGMFALIFGLSLKQSQPEAKRKMWAYIILSLSSIVFWALYLQAPMGLNLFIERNVDRNYLGILLAPQWVQNINTVIIIIGAPLLGVLFTSLRKRGTNISIPIQFCLALLLIGLGFIVLPIGIHFANATTGLVNFNWVLCSYILQSLGELFISPIGYAMVGELAPFRLRGLMMGMWMMLTGLAAVLSSHFTKLALMNDSLNPVITNPGFSHTFITLGLSAIGVSVLLLTLVPFLRRLITSRS